MTGIERIRSAVLDSAETEAARIVQAAERHAADVVEAGKKAAREEAEQQYRARARAIEEEYARKVIQIKGAANKELLDKKNDRLRAVFDMARERILAWPAEEYGKVMARLVERAAGESGGLLRVHPDDRAMFSGILAELNARREERSRIELDETSPLSMRGGFLFVASDYEVDLTLGAIFADIERELLPELAALMFSE